MGDLTLPYTPEQEATLKKVISDIMNQLLPVNEIDTLNRAEAYRLYRLATNVSSHVDIYVNTAWARFDALSKPKEDVQRQVLLRKIERALSKDGTNIDNLISSLNERSVS